MAIKLWRFSFLRKILREAVLAWAVESALKQRLRNRRDVSTFTNKRPRGFGQFSQYVTICDVVDGKLTVERNGHAGWLRTMLSQLGR